MPANRKVSVAWQIIFTFIPILNLWAFYRIKKLRKYFLYIIVPMIAVSIGIAVYISSKTDSVEASFAYPGYFGMPFGDPNVSASGYLKTNCLYPPSLNFN